MPVSLQSLVEEKNPAWNETNANEDLRFNEAMHVVGDIFTRQLHYLHTVFMPCRSMVETAIVERHNVRFIIFCIR